ncbi:MAG: hypothetical protein AB201_01750 [Parcubacteria bacterium C7867-006]|nr:MAG: hypothetical protein AB201_01750 [Parcubacteria bacterium C7867-006]
MSHEKKIKNESGETMKAGCVVVNDNNEVLLVSRVDEDIWSYPKGHAEAGENLEDVAVREVLEETGYEVEIISRLSDLKYLRGGTDEEIVVAMFKAKSLGQKATAEEGTKSKWFPLEEAKKVVYTNIAYLLGEV